LACAVSLLAMQLSSAYPRVVGRATNPVETGDKPGGG
jgi:hypothetical protein